MMRGGFVVTYFFFSGHNAFLIFHQQGVERYGWSTLLMLMVIMFSPA